MDQADNQRGKFTYMHFLEKVCGIYWAIYDEQGVLLESCKVRKRADMEKLWENELKKACANSGLIDRKKSWENIRLHQISENVFIWSISVDNGTVLLGPVCSSRVTADQIHAFAHHNQIKREYLNMQRFSMNQLLNLAEFVYYGLTGIVLSDSEIAFSKNMCELLYGKEKANYDLYRVQEENQRSSYENELYWLERIRRGQEVVTTEYASISEVGMLAKNSDYKQCEYMLVSGITLATRAAIDGGVPPFIAYETSDMLLQRLSQCKSISQMIENCSEFTALFSNLVREYIDQKKGGELVERCKEYIARHLYSNFTIRQMAEELALNRSHMSRTFSQKTGTTIQTYIRAERLKAAANLLKYSNESIAQISDYMHFSSPSRFSGYFREKYGITPRAYREENQLIEFKEKSN